MKLYAISDEILTPYKDLPNMLNIALDAGIELFQFRDKKNSDDKLLPLCVRLARICEAKNAEFIINDRMNLALKLQDLGLKCGIHLGKDDWNGNKNLKAKFKGMVGISCYGDLVRAKTYEKLASYVAFGSIFKSPTKPDSSVVGVEILKEAKAILDIPICAIGGINTSNINQINADICALVSSIWIGDIKKNVEALKLSSQYNGKSSANSHTQANA